MRINRKYPKLYNLGGATGGDPEQFCFPDGRCYSFDELQRSDQGMFSKIPRALAKAYPDRVIKEGDSLGLDMSQFTPDEIVDALKDFKEFQRNKYDLSDEDMRKFAESYIPYQIQQQTDLGTFSVDGLVDDFSRTDYSTGTRDRERYMDFLFTEGDTRGAEDFMGINPLTGKIKGQESRFFDPPMPSTDMQDPFQPSDREYNTYYEGLGLRPQVGGVDRLPVRETRIPTQDGMRELNLPGAEGIQQPQQPQTIQQPQTTQQTQATQQSRRENPHKMILEGETREEYMQRMNEQGFDMEGAGEFYDMAERDDAQGREGFSDLPGYMPFFAGDTDYNLFQLGQYAGLPQGTRGRGLGIAGAAGASLLSGARQFTSGLGTSVQDARTYADSLQNLDAQRRGFTTDRRTFQDPNQRTAKYGGLFGFEDGGMMPAEQQAMLEEEMAMQQAQEQDPQSQGMPAEQEVMEIAQQLVEQFQGDLNSIQAFLQQEGMEPQLIEQVLIIAEQMMMQQQEQPQQEPGAEFPKSQVMRDTINRRMDMPIEFKAGGRKRYPKLY